MQLHRNGSLINSGGSPPFLVSRSSPKVTRPRGPKGICSLSACGLLHSCFVAPQKPVGGFRRPSGGCVFRLDTILPKVVVWLANPTLLGVPGLLCLRGLLSLLAYLALPAYRFLSLACLFAVLAQLALLTALLHPSPRNSPTALSFSLATKHKFLFLRATSSDGTSSS